MEPIYLDTTFILIGISFLPAYVTLIILIILLYSFCFRIIKESSRIKEYYQQNQGETVEQQRNSRMIPTRIVI